MRGSCEANLSIVCIWQALWKRMTCPKDFPASQRLQSFLAPNRRCAPGCHMASMLRTNGRRAPRTLAHLRRPRKTVEFRCEERRAVASTALTARDARARPGVGCSQGVGITRRTRMAHATFAGAARLVRPEFLDWLETVPLLPPNLRRISKPCLLYRPRRIPVRARRHSTFGCSDNWSECNELRA